MTRRRRHRFAESADPTTAGRKFSIATARRPGKEARIPPGLLADTPEEARRRGYAADELFRELVRRAHEG